MHEYILIMEKIKYYILLFKLKVHGTVAKRGNAS